MSERSSERSTLVLEDAFAAGSPDCFDGVLDGCEAANGTGETDECDRTDVLSVVFCGQVDGRLDALQARSDVVGSVAVVAVGPAAAGAGVSESPAVQAVPDPADLTGVGIATTEWARGRDPDGRAVVCVDSLSTVLQYSEAERVFRFLHTLLGQFRTAGIDAHVHMDPEAHDDRTVAQFRQLFDEVREASADPGHRGSRSDASARDMATDGGELD